MKTQTVAACTGTAQVQVLIVKWTWAPPWTIRYLQLTTDGRGKRKLSFHFSHWLYKSHVKEDPRPSKRSNTKWAQCYFWRIFVSQCIVWGMFSNLIFAHILWFLVLCFVGLPHERMSVSLCLHVFSVHSLSIFSACFDCDWVYHFVVACLIFNEREEGGGDLGRWRGSGRSCGCEDMIKIYCIKFYFQLKKGKNHFLGLSVMGQENNPSSKLSWAV